MGVFTGWGIGKCDQGPVDVVTGEALDVYYISLYSSCLCDLSLVT